MTWLQRHEDDGSILPLIVFYTALSLAIIFLVVATTSLYLERKRLFTVADSASLIGAESFDLDDVHDTSAGYRPVLTSEDVAAAVNSYLHDNPTPEFANLRVDRAESTDGRSATVELSADWTPPVLTMLVPKGFRIQVTSSARSVFS
jgi:hypothetical protein